jgi:hypothetical protein
VNEADEFLTRYGTASFPHAAQLVPLLRSSAFTQILRHDSTLPCRHFAEIYRRRADSLEHLHGRDYDSEMWREFTELVAQLSISPDEPCRLWQFISPEHHYSAFEMAASQRIAGCFYRHGTNSNATGNA